MQSQSELDEVLIPIVVGVTGHRDLRPEDLSTLKSKVREILKDILERHPSSPIHLLCPLSEGADRVVAQAGLELASQLGRQKEFILNVPLPMSVEEYKKDFGTEDSRTEFDHLLSQAKSSYELPMILQNKGMSSISRDLRYANVGAYIARHSQILIALWDGKSETKEGGTAHVVQFKLQGLPEPFVKSKGPLSQTESGMIYHIITPRLSQPEPKGKKFSIKKLFPPYRKNDARAELIYQGILARIENYNWDIKKLVSKGSDKLILGRTEILPYETEKDVNPRCRLTLNRYACADFLAKKFKRDRVASIVALLILVLVGFSSFQLYHEFFHDYRFLVAYPVALLAAGSIYWFARRRDYEYKHEDYRALAEALRVQFFWSLCGIKEDCSDHYLHKHKGELEWIRYALRVWARDDRPEQMPTSANELTNYHGMVQQHWVLHQRDWFNENEKRDLERLARCEQRARWFFGMGMCVASVLVLVEIFKPDQVRLFEDPVAAIIALSLATSAAFQAYAEKMALSEQTKQYRRMVDLYSLASERLEQKLKINDVDGATKILTELGKEALIENGDWLMLHRARPLEVPKS